MKKAEKFAGNKKSGASLLMPLEKKFTSKHVGSVPKWLETYHLTSLTILWSALIIVFGFLARSNINWLWASSLMIFFQYATDLFDRAVGRHRNTGLIKWGFYMDHFLDYVFLSSILIGYAIILPLEFAHYTLFILAIFGAFMIESFLSFAATNEFQIAHAWIGPTEVRIIFILINTLLIIFGKTYMSAALPYVLALSLIGLIYVVYKNHKRIWQIDMEHK